MTDLISCPNCNVPNRATAKFCANCGITLPSAGLSENPPQQADSSDENVSMQVQIAPGLSETSPSTTISDDTAIINEPEVPSGEDVTADSGKTAALNVNASAYVQIVPGRVMNNRYTILRALGKGGMGKVYLASETIANRQRQVVVKEMLEYFDPNDPEGETKARQRFEAEAATLVGLNFSSIPQIFDFFSDVGRNYIVMQFIEGRNLESSLTHLDEEANLVPGEPYAVERVRQWGVQICKVLENLSALNIVHMDVKPPNLILDKSGDVWLVDFGTAKAQWVVATTGQLGMQKSSIYGTIGFAPPEQYSGKAEPRSDVYALAATLYHLMTNDDPRRHPFSFPKIDTLPADIANALKRALEKDVTRRVTAEEFRQLLSGSQRYGSQSTNPPFRWQDGTISVEPRDLVEPASRCWDEALEYFSADGWENWFRALHRNDVLSSMEAAKQAVSQLPHNQAMPAALDAFLRSLDPALPPAKLYVETAAIQLGAVRRDEQKTVSLALKNQGGGWLSGSITGLPVWLHVDSPHFGFHDHKAIQFTVNPARLQVRSQPHVAQLILDAGTAGQMEVPFEVAVRRPRWYNSVLGRLAMAAILLVLIFSALALVEYRWVGWTVVRFNPLVQGTLHYGILFTSTRDGKQDIYRISGSGTERITYTAGKGESWWPVPDPKGGVLFTSNRDGKREIYRLSAAGAERLTNTPGDAESWFAVPELGGGILFTSTRDGKREIYRLAKDGEIARITNTPGDSESWDAVPVWNGDILFTSNRDGKAEIYRMQSGDAGAISRVTVTPGEAESISPVMGLNGDIIFTSNRDGQWEIYRLQANGEIIRMTESPAGDQSWVAYPELGGNMLFSSNRDGKSEIYRLTKDGLERVTTTSGDGESFFAPMPEQISSEANYSLVVKLASAVNYIARGGWHGLWSYRYAACSRSGS